MKSKEAQNATGKAFSWKKIKLKKRKRKKK